MTLITRLNGRLPSTVLTIADTGANGPQRLRLDAADSWQRMLSAGMPARCLRSGYRTLAQQAAQDPALAAPVGQSQHGEGLAADVDEPARSWITRNGAAYGWRIGFVRGEPWHTEYNPANDTHVSAPSTTLPKPRKKAKMLHFLVKDDTAPRGAKYVILMHDGRRCNYTSNSSEFPNGIAANIGNAVLTDEALITALQKQLWASGPATATATIDPAAIKAAMPTAAQIAALVPAAQDNSNSIAAQVVAGVKAWLTRA